MATKTSEFGGYDKAVKYDLGTFVISVDRLKKQGKPFANAFNFIVSIVSWKYPVLTLLVMPAIILMIVFWPEYLVAFLLVPFPILMFVTLIKKLGTRKAKFTDYHRLFIRKDESPQLIAKRAATLQAQAHLEMYLHILLEIQDLCNEVSSKCEIFYSVIYWKAWKQALLFYCTILSIIFGLFTIKARYLVASLLFCATVLNPGFKNALKDIVNYFCKMPTSMKSKKPEALIEISDDETVEELEQKDYDLQVKGTYPIAEEDESSSSTDSEDLAIKPENKPVSLTTFEKNQERQREKSGLSFMSKFASSTLASFTRRHRKHGGNCASCDVQFSTILKKRNYCRHCGNSYCSKCCHQRVPKVVFGATAPAAYEERVLVCKSCFAFLMNRMRGTNTEIVE